ncbi:MAG: peptidoglycan-binding protein [Leptolyngbyaceae cyanobacterium]
MFHRLLLIALTSIAASGLGVPAIARTSERSSAVLQLAQSDRVAQLDNADTEPSPPVASPAVRSLQNRLGQLGYYEGAADGVFNPATSAALKAFQQNNGLVGTGILDPLTEDRLLDRDAVPANIEGAAADDGEPDLKLPGPTTDEPTDELPAPEEESSELPAPPEGSDPESIIESADADSTDAPAEDTPASVADNEGFSLEGMPNDGEADSEAADDGDPAEDATAEAAASPESAGGLFRLVLLGIIIMAVGALGTGLVLWFARQKAQKAAELDNQAPDGVQVLGNEAIAPPELSSAPVAKPPAPPPSPYYSKNGQPAAVSDSEPAQLAVNPPPPPMPLSVIPESRVSKVNIIDELIQDLQESDPVRRRKSIWELGQRGNSAAVQPLANLLTEADSTEQGLILAALAEISTKTLKPMNRAMAMALQDDNPEVRKNAIRDLTRIYDSLGQVGRMLGQASVDDDPEVRQTANWALDQLNKMRLSATDTARSLQDSRLPRERLPDDESSSHRA